MALRTPADLDVLELDVARASVMGDGVLAAMTAHLGSERQLGAYQAAARRGALLDEARTLLAGLAGVPGGRVEFVGNGTEAVRSLVEGWPLAADDTVLVPRSEFLSNRLALDRLARRGVEVLEAAEDGTGRVDPDGVVTALRTGRVRLVVLSHVQSQRGIVQPVGEVLSAAAAVDVPVLVDACQSLGHVPAPAGAAAVAGTSRKWLHGPRGVGFVVVDPRWWARLDAPGTLHSHVGAGAGTRADPGVALFEPAEAPVAARVGLATAVAELVAAGPGEVAAALAAKGRLLRGLLAERLPGVPLGEPLDEPSAIVTLHPQAAGAAAAIVAALDASGVRAGLVPAGRALDSPRDVARLSPAPWVPDAGLEHAADVVLQALRRTA